MQVLKKEKLFPFEKSKIKNAIIQANNQISFPDFDTIDNIVNDIENELEAWNCDVIKVEEIENLVMSYLYREMPDVAREYSSYKIKKEHSLKNPSEIEKVLFNSPEIKYENGNKNTNLTHIKNSYLAEIPSKEFMKQLLPKECQEVNEKKIVAFHDAAFSARPLTNCCLFNLEEIFKGCEINSIYIETPKSFRTACTVATQALSHATNLQYGLK